MTMFGPIEAVPLPHRATLLLQLWERSLKDAAEALLAEVQLVSADERRAVPSLWEALHERVCDAGPQWCGVFEELRDAASDDAQRGAAPHDVVADGVAMELPEVRWVHALASASDPSRSFLERLPALRRLETMCRARGYFGHYERDVRVWLGLQEALRIREVEIAADATGVLLEWGFAT